MTLWYLRHQAKLQFGLRMTLAALFSFALGEALGMAQTYWAVLSSVIVTQGSVGGSLRVAVNRLIGTVGGAIWGAAVALAVPHASPLPLGAALLAAIGPLAVLTAFRPDYRVAPITAIIVLMGASGQQAGPMASAISRVFEISLGSAIAVAVALFILPARAHRLLARAASATVATMADMAALLEMTGKGSAAETLLHVQSRLRAAIAQTETRAEEAKIERANRLSDGPDPEPLARNFRRLRHDLAMLARVLAEPFSAPVRDRLGPTLEVIFAALAAWFTATSKALAQSAMPPELTSVQQAMEGYKAALTNAGQEKFSYTTGNHDTQRVFALLFLFEQMLQNLQDLADRTSELAAGKGQSPGKR
jgi:uncharacterized membrane protein YccC